MESIESIESMESMESIESGRIYNIPIDSDKFPRIQQNIAELSGEVFPDEVWCRSLKHRHFCATVPRTSDNVQFLIPSIETLFSVIGSWPIEGFLIASKLSEKKI